MSGFKLKTWHVVVLLAVGLFFLFNKDKAMGRAGQVGVDCPDFKSNYGETGSYYSSSTWAAVDCNGDGDYEAYGKTSSGSDSLPPSQLGRMDGRTTEGFEYECDGYGWLKIHDNENTYCRMGSCYAKYRINYGPADDADLSCGESPSPSPGPVEFEAKFWNSDGTTNSVTSRQEISKGESIVTDYESNYHWVDYSEPNGLLTVYEGNGKLFINAGTTSDTYQEFSIKHRFVKDNSTKWAHQYFVYKGGGGSNQSGGYCATGKISDDEFLNIIREWMDQR